MRIETKAGPLRSLILLVFIASAATLNANSTLSQWEVDQPIDRSYEMQSPEEFLTRSAEPGLSERAIPMIAPGESQDSYLPLFQLSKFQDMQSMYPDRNRALTDTAPFRPVTTDIAPIGLHPRVYRKGLIEFYPWFGLAQSWESNVNLTSSNQISDFYITPRAGAEVQIGTPDSPYNEFLDTIVALNARYEAWADMFFNHTNLSAFNQQVNLAGRIGRTSAIWRPYFSFSDITGSNLLIAELVNRTRRLRTGAGLAGQYQFTGQLGMNQTFDFFQLEHPDPGYINYDMLKTRQELTWKVTEQMKMTAWGEYRYTDPSQGFSGSEFFYGLGFYGRPDPRIYSELRIGYDSMEMQGNVPGRRDMSGLRFNGYTTFDMSARVRIAFIYDRDYVFNEQTVDDNYVSTLLQVKAETYLGGGWYVTPYFGGSLQQFETSGGSAIQLRPELEVAYALPSSYYPNDSKIFVKAGYMSYAYIQGTGSAVENLRLSMGFNCKF